MRPSKTSEIQTELDKRVRSIIGEDSDGFWFSGMASDRGVPWSQIGYLEFGNSFFIDSKRELNNKKLFEKRILEALIKIKEQVEERIERIL